MSRLIQGVNRRAIKLSLAGALVAAVLASFSITHATAQKKGGDKLLCTVNLLDHPSLNASLKGFEDAINSNNKDGKIALQKFNASGSMQLVPDLLRQTLNAKCDLVFALTTPVATLARKVVAAKGVPVVYTAVTDPVGAGIVESMEKDTLPVTGYTDLYPVEEQVSLFVRLSPSANTVGILYNPTEQNSQRLVALTKAALEAKGKAVSLYGNQDPALVAETTRRAAKAQEMLIVNGDNLFTAELDIVIKIARDAKVPLYVGDPDSVTKGAVATVGPSYYDLGYKSGMRALEVLDGTFAGKLASENPKGHDYFINAKAASTFGVEITAEKLSIGSVWTTKK
jgi:putative ABC transport system substrate-binding protein